jgi:arsenate reductase-like glutaredoxin family protein
MLRQVDLYLVQNDPGCTEVREFLEQQDLRLQIRDLNDRPLNAEEISGLIRHFNLRHFLNTSSKVYAKNRLDKFLPGRKEIIKMMANDNDLLKKPIIVAGRLMVVGPNRKKIMEMLQIRSNGSDPAKEKAAKEEDKKSKS